MTDRQTEFRNELQSLINRYSQENGSDTPDFIIADYLVQCLHALNIAMNSREKWYGRGDGTFSVKVELPAPSATSKHVP